MLYIIKIKKKFKNTYKNKLGHTRIRTKTTELSVEVMLPRDLPICSRLLYH
jgi:hypothetical protein